MVPWQHERYPILRPVTVVRATGRGEGVRALRMSRPQKGASQTRGQIQTGFSPSGRGSRLPKVRVAR